jgi:hypothetical protein
LPEKNWITAGIYLDGITGGYCGHCHSRGPLVAGFKQIQAEGLADRLFE